ncbi:MAG: TetR/AcrR family transcriptional regulator [Synechococcales cyanobacterium RM1_1_8]|nr:TetR/AcrR family transcriptional regulator [Synechococcales cyanobacterium RM1_1_8]
MARASKRNLVLDTAETLFVRNGYAATGINQITQDAGIASMTLYNNFKNKDDLVIAVLDRRHDAVFGAIEAAIVAAGPKPEQKILAIFDYLIDHIEAEASQNGGVYPGCAFNNAASEFRQLSSPIHQIAIAHYQRIADTIAALAKAMQHPDPTGLGQTLMILANGAMASTQVMGDLSLAKRARRAAESLIGA